jgi:hypothetical protein
MVGTLWGTVMLSSDTRRTAAVVAAFLAGAALAWAPLTSVHLPFRETSGYPVWVFLIATSCAVCPLVWISGRRALRQVPAISRPRRTALRVGLVAVALALAVSVLTGVVSNRPDLDRPATEQLLPYLGWRFRLVYLAAAVAVVPGVVAMYRVGAGCARGEGRLADLVTWRAILRSQLAALGALVALGTLSTGALRNSILTVAPADADRFPAEYVLLFGAALTMILALAYIPPSQRLRERAQALIDEAFPLPTEPTGNWQQNLQGRRDLAELLRVDDTPGRSIQNALIIGGPLISSALGLLIPAG